MMIGLPSAPVAGVPARGRGRPGQGGVAPICTAMPALSGAGRVGALLIVSVEVEGDPAPLLSFRWLRDGAPIPGAGGPGYAPVTADDLAAIHCRVTATNSVGSVSAESAEVVVREDAPVVLGLADHSFLQGDGVQTIAAAEGFEGAALLFTLSGPAGLGIDPTIGALTVPTAAPLGPVIVTIRASNSGGAADVSFTLAVLARGPEPKGDNVIRFDTVARRFDSTTARFDGATAMAVASFDSTVLRFDGTAARFDGFVPDAAPAGGFDSSLLRFDMSGVRFDGAQFAPPAGGARFDADMLSFDLDTLRFDAAILSTDAGNVAPAVSFPHTYDEAA